MRPHRGETGSIESRRSMGVAMKPNDDSRPTLLLAHKPLNAESRSNAACKLSSVFQRSLMVTVA